MKSDTQENESKATKICQLVSLNCTCQELKCQLELARNDHRLACIRLSSTHKTALQLNKTVESINEQICGRDIPLLIESRIDLVLPLNLDGVHFVEGPKKVRKARRQLGRDKVIGAFCDSSRHLAMLAGENGADYVSFGPVCRTDNLETETASTELFDWWRQMTVLPCMAEGGINRDNASEFSDLADFLLLEQ